MLAAAGYAAAQARVRGRRTRLVSDHAWSRLIDADDEAGALTALRDTPYAAAADDPAGLGRGVGRRQRDEILTLARTVPSAAGALLRSYARRFEIHDIGLLLRVLHQGLPVEAAIGAMTTTLGDPFPLAVRDARTVAALVDALQRGPFGRALAIAWERYVAERRTFYLEVALDLAFGRALVDQIEAQAGGDRADARRLLGAWIARSNLLAAARYRAARGVTPEEVVNFCLHRDLGGGLPMVQRIAAGGSLADEAAALGVDVREEVGELARLAALEHRTEVLRRREARRRLGRTPFGLGFVLAYVIELEAEGADLVTVVEAKRQGLAAEALRRRLGREAGPHARA